MIDSKRLKTLMDEKGVGQVAFAESVKITQSAASDYLKNKNRNLRSDALIRIADYFDVSVDYLLGRSESRNQTVNGNISKSAFVQGTNQGTVSYTDSKTCNIESNLHRIFEKLDFEGQLKLLNLAYTLETEFMERNNG